MNRRRFLREGIAGGAIALGAGGFLYFRRSQARADMTSRMLDDALPPLSSNALRELNTLPVRAREEIRRYFHGKCLNVEGFVSHVCSNQFAERLGRCRTQDEREGCFLQAFCGRVATDAEILNQVETIAAEIGSELDSGWDGYCTELCGRWNTRIQGYGSPLAMDELSNRLGGMIRAELAQTARQAVSTYQRPAVGETIGKIGASALLLLPLGVVSVAVAGPAVAVMPNPLVIPVFFILAARHVWEYITGRLDDRRGEYQAAISSRLALLGNRVGAEFEREVRQRLTDLHTWQERSIRITATRLAEERVGLI
jgi:hypothetical protein